MRYEPKNGCKCDESRLHTLSHSGFCWLSHENKGRVTIPKTDEFLEKIQTAFNPLPLFFEKSCCNFFKLHAQKALFKDPKSATSIFRTFLKTHPFRCRHPSLNIMLKDHVNSMVWHYMYNDCKVEIDTARGVLDASSGITRYWFVSKWKIPRWIFLLSLITWILGSQAGCEEQLFFWIVGRWTTLRQRRQWRWLLHNSGEKGTILPTMKKLRLLV